MGFELSRKVASNFIELDFAASTNTEMVALAENLPHLSVLLTRNQTAGRARLGRSWVTPPGASLAVSVLIRPELPDGGRLNISRWGWFPVIAGLALTTTLLELIPTRTVGFKWPNDVLVDGKKICGILSETLPTQDALVVGCGVNTRMSKDQLPIPMASSLAVLGLDVDDGLEDYLLASYLRALASRVGRYLDSFANADAAGLRAEASTHCLTLGRQVRIELPGGEFLFGEASELDTNAQIVIEQNGVFRSVAAGDVIHMR